MSDNAFEKQDLIRFTSEPVERQFQRILAKITEAISWSKGDMIICFSGGKDSALLLDMYCECVGFMNKNDSGGSLACAKKVVRKNPDNH